MTPAQYLAAARDIVILAAIGLLLWWVYQGGQNAVKADDLKALQTQIQQQAKQLSAWRQEATDANAQLSKDVSAINAAAPIVHQWMPQPACAQPAMLPAAPAETSQPHPSAGGIQSGSGAAALADRRDAIVADFKRQWETEFARCRALDAQWPSTE